jgi:hypothetical protein
MPEGRLRRASDTGKFAEGTEHGGVDYSNKQFDSTFDGKSKKHKPLHFQHFGGKAIRGWDEALKTMSLGEKASLTIGPKWAYRKAAGSHGPLPGSRTALHLPPWPIWRPLAPHPRAATSPLACARQGGDPGRQRRVRGAAERDARLRDAARRGARCQAAGR